MVHRRPSYGQKELNMSKKINTPQYPDIPVLSIFEDGVEYTVLQPIAELIGLNWDEQLAGIKTDPVFNGHLRRVPLKPTGKTEYVTCLPVVYYMGWFMRFNPNDFTGDDRKRVIVMQYGMLEGLSELLAQ
jgi:hypothetical protein